jgi:hypothetical protein
MRTRSAIAALVVAQALAESVAKAQPDLPPPPPPPMGLPPELPPPPSPPSAPRASPSPSAPRSPPAPASGPTVPAQAPAAGRSPPPAPARRVSAPPAPVRRRRPEGVAVLDDEPRRRPLALTINPLPVFFGRVSGNAEVLLLPHHSLVLSPNALLFPADRGGRGSLISEGMGFATRGSSSLGLELGYRFWWRANDALRGPFLGPSLLVGTTTQSSVDPSRAMGYWGLAVDIGAQEVLRGGFTVGAGAGLGFVRIEQGVRATAFFPRLLVQVGWSL